MSRCLRRMSSALCKLGALYAQETCLSTPSLAFNKTVDETVLGFMVIRVQFVLTFPRSFVIVVV